MTAISADRMRIPVLLESKNQCRCDSDSTSFMSNKQPTSGRPARRSLSSWLLYQTKAKSSRGDTAMDSILRKA
uniref:Uncharacterized protein n=1 Tax=Arundo donax TaxID=35708 RepID=A0A0A9FUE7_ARUDO